MGSAASTTGPTVDESTLKKTGSSKHSGKSSINPSQTVLLSNKNDTPQLFIDDSPLVEGGLSTGQDSNNEDKPGMSSNKLKKLALGIQGYKDQQRDYDTTLGTLEVNKTTQMIWSEPKCDEAFSTPKSKLQHPSSPNKFKEVEIPFSTPQHPNRSTQPLAISSFNQRTPLSNSANSSSANDLTLSGSFSRGPHNTPVIGPLTPGPPPGLPSRPFPRNHEMDDGLSADFSAEQSLQRHPSKPQNVPTLNIPTPTSNKLQPPMSGGPTGGMQQGALQQFQGPPPGNVIIPRQFMSPGPGPMGKNMSPFPVGSPPPRFLGPRGPFPIPNGSPPPANIAAGISIQGPGSGGSGIMPMNLGPRRSAPIPVVKETTVVKRNKVDLPTNFNHAKPTAGDWLNKRYFVNNYILLDTLGVGSYGEVWSISSCHFLGVLII